MEQYTCILELNFVDNTQKSASAMIYRKTLLPFNPLYMRGEIISPEFTNNGINYHGYDFEIKRVRWSESNPEMYYVVLHKVLASMNVCLSAKEKFLKDEKGRYSETYPH